MEKRPPPDHRRGGGRGGGLRRKGSGGRSSYRRVQASISDCVDDSSTKATQDDKLSDRVVHIVDAATPPPVPFKSSLRASLNDTLQSSRGNTVSEKSLQVQTKGQRPIVSASSPSPRTGAGKTTKFVSSLKQSIKLKDEVGSRQENENCRGRAMQSSKPHGLVSREPLRRSNSREHVQRADSRDHPHRARSRESRQQSLKEHESHRLGNRSVSKARLTRKNSTDSVSSQRSDCSDRCPRSERYNKSYSSTLYGGPQYVRKITCELTPPKLSLEGPMTKSPQDGRAQKQGSVSGTIGSSLSRIPQDSSRRLSLDGEAGTLRRLNLNSSVRSPSASNGQTVRRADLANPQRIASPLGDLIENEDAFVRNLIPPKFVQEEETLSTQTSSLSVVDKTERTRLADTLRERMDAQKLERGGSLADILKNPSAWTCSMENEVRRHSSFSVTKRIVKEQAPGEFSADKNSRTREYYARLDKEDAQRESTRRVAHFTSSLASSLKNNSATCHSSLAASNDGASSRTIGSSLSPSSYTQPVQAQKLSLAAALALSRSTVVRAKKLQYSFTELKSLMAFAIPRPPDLIDMKIKEVIKVRNPNLGIKRSIGRLAPDSFGIGKSIGGCIRKSGRLGGRGMKDQVVLDSRRDKQGGRGGRGGSRGGRRVNGRGGFSRLPPPPLYDGPIAPLTVSENRWKPTKEKEASPSEKTLSNVKSMLNKLTREKFTKLTNELCSVNINTFVLLSSIVSIIMDKAIEEPNFADVYADLCKEFHARTVLESWSFLSVLSDEDGSFFWTAIDKATFKAFAGPFDSPRSCLDDIGACESAASTKSDWNSISLIKYRLYGDNLVAVGEKKSGVYYYAKRSISEIGDEEPFGGPFKSVELARHAGIAQTTFKRLLVNRCQGEFEKTNQHIGSHGTIEKVEEVDPRRHEILAMRAKAKMLGNIRFIGELYKVDLVKHSGVQGCIFYLLGLELITGKDGQEVQAQTVRFPDEQDVEALCKMLATAGKKFDQPNTKTIMKIIILRMVELSNDTKLPSRARFLVKDILETRDHMWEPRRKELQQKTLEEVRREAQKLQQQGKNAQHDDVQRRRQKTRVSSAQLAKQSSNLIVTKKEPELVESPDPSSAQPSVRIKSIIQEYLSIMDLNEAIACVQELPVGPCHIELAEQVINTALESKTHEREHAVDLLVGLYEHGTLDANSIQTALLNVMEFLEDLKIDLPLIHQYSALIFGRLVTTGCFGLSWIISEALAHCVDCKLTSLVFPEVLSVLESETDERTVIRMLTDEEITPESVLPLTMRNEVEVKAYLHEHGIQYYFIDGEDELDEEIVGKMRNTLEEYLSVRDFQELVLCIEELVAVPDRWRHFVHIMLMFGIEVKPSIRKDVTELLVQLTSNKKVKPEDIEAAAEIMLDDYDDLRVDVPQLAANLSELWTPLFAMEALSVQWLCASCSHLIESGYAADILDALLSTFESQEGLKALASWWKKQTDADAVWAQMSFTEEGAPNDERLSKWKSALQ